MGYDRGDSFPFEYEPNGIPFGSKSKGKLSPRSYPIQFVSDARRLHTFQPGPAEVVPCLRID